MKNIHVRVRFFCTTHGLFKAFVIFHLCIFLWSAIIVALSIVCPGPEISAYHNFTATMPLFTWQNKFYSHIGAIYFMWTTFVVAQPQPVIQSQSQNIPLLAPRWYFHLRWHFLFMEVCDSLILLDSYGPDRLNPVILDNCKDCTSIVYHFWYFLFMEICDRLIRF